MTSIFVAAPALKLTFTMSTTCCAWSAPARALARPRSALATASRAARTSELAVVTALASVAREMSNAACRSTRWPRRNPLSRIGTVVCSRKRQLFWGRKNWDGYVDEG